MLPRTLPLASLLLLSAVGLAHAEVDSQVWAKRDTRLRSQPGETASIVGRADKGERLEVVSSRGRWLRVRHGRRVGWVTRSQVENRTATAPRKRSERTGFSGKPVQDALRVEVAIDKVRGFDDPRTKANMTLNLERGEVVTVLGRGYQDWILVEHSDGQGWIPESAVTDGAKFAGDPRLAPGEAKVAAAPAPAPAAAAPTADAPKAVKAVRVASAAEVAAAPVAAPAKASVVSKPASVPARRSKLAAGMMGTAGAQMFAMRQTGAGAEGFAQATGPAAAIGGGARYNVMRDLWVGGSADAQMGSAELVYSTATETSQPMATQGVAMDARAEVAWGPSWMVAFRTGYHYSSLTVESDRSEAMLTGEQIAGMTVGLGGAMPVGKRFAVSAAVDVMPAGIQRPAELTPGILYATGVQSAWARATFAVRLPAHILGGVSYRGGMTSADLTDGAEEPTTAARTDQSHTITAGLGLTW